MNSGVPRVAYFADSFHEVNGVALTSRQLESYAERHGYPFLSVHTGPETRSWQMGSVTRQELKLHAATVRLEADLRFDPAFPANRKTVLQTLEPFQPDVIHVTGPSHHGILGAWLAWRLKLPLVASWHTNIHEFGARRLRQNLSFLPGRIPEGIENVTERGILAATLRFYRLARVTLAPNPGLMHMLEQATGHPCYPMRRGVDTHVFEPAKRDRSDDAIVIGYVGRLSPEKNVRLLAEVERRLRAAGITNYRIACAGHGSETPWLRENLKQYDYAGVLRGDALARFYASFDIFAFPSETDTYGNVVQEAMASGVPCVVTDKGGPASIVTHGRDGFIAATGQPFCDAVVRLASDADLRAGMAGEARATALRASWDRVFETVYEAYREAIAPARRAAA